jgi:site-specific DNA-methyltransferase (adenine-specific)
VFFDGHGRRELDLDAEWDVDIYDLTDAEADLAVATFDPIGWQAEQSRAQLDALLREVSTGDAALQKLLSDVAEESGLYFGNEAAAPGAGGDDFDTTPEETQTRVMYGDLWQCGEHRVLCGDSTKAEDVGRVMAGEKAEMVWTDPPYGVSVGDKNKWLNSIAPSNRVEENLHNDSLDEAGLLTMLTDAFTNAAIACTAGAAWYVAAPAGPLHLLFGQVLKSMNIWRQTLQWVKNNSTFSPMGVSYHWKAEPIFYGWMPNGAHRYHGDRTQTTVWEIDRPQASPEHPTMKPVELVARAVGHASLAGEIVLDVFGGSGTTLIACERTNRKARLIEIEPKYVNVILSRWEAETGKQPQLLERLDG